MSPGRSPRAGQSWVSLALPDPSLCAPQLPQVLIATGPSPSPQAPPWLPACPPLSPVPLPSVASQPKLLPFPGDGDRSFPVRVLAWFLDVPVGGVARRRLGEKAGVEWPGRRAGFTLLA